jgi:hypothetical protein
LQLSFPVTAAGPSPIPTGFPIKLYYEHLNNRGNINWGDQAGQDQYQSIARTFDAHSETYDLDDLEHDVDTDTSRRLSFSTGLKDTVSLFDEKLRFHRRVGRCPNRFRKSYLRNR